MSALNPVPLATAGVCTATCQLYSWQHGWCDSHSNCLIASVRPRVIREKVVRSAEDGHCRTPIQCGDYGRTVVEEVELHCRALTFEIVM